MPEDWEFIAALPGISMKGTVEAVRTAIVPVGDERCAAGRLREEGRVKSYLSKFRSIILQPVDSVLMIREVGARTMARDDVTFLRNCFAVSVVFLARANRSRRHFGTGPTFSDVFDLPPASLRRDPGMIIETPAVLSTGPGEDFCGHPSPTYPFGKAEALEWDKPLLDALLSVWRSPKRGPRSTFRARVARLLEVTYTAMRAPTHNLSSGNDWGVVLALWVSAFETLTNVAGSVSFSQVRAVIENVPWPRRLRRRLAPYEYRSLGRRAGPPLGRMIRPVQVYARLYRARNMVLHGEEYEHGRLEPGRRHRTWGPLHLEAGVVLRCALLWMLARNGHGVYLTPPSRAEAARMTFKDNLIRWRDVGFAHDSYMKALGRGLRPTRS